jgi:hypothetical protein
MIVQKYHSLSEIEDEFILSLNDLVSDSFMDTESIKLNEKDFPESSTFHYYLFFGVENNSPVGFCRFIFNSLTETEPKLFGLLKKQVISKSCELNLQGRFDSGLFCHPKYEKQVYQKLIEILEELRLRPEIKSIITYTSNILKNFPYDCKSIPLGYLKTHNNYKEYFDNLLDLSKNMIQSNWKTLNKNQILLGKYQKLREMFATKTDGLLRYKAVKEENLVKKYEHSCHHFLSIETNERPLAIIFYFPKNKYHYFDYIILDESLINPAIVHEFCIMHFYEQENGQWLYPLDKLELSHPYLNSKKIYISKIK